MKKVLVPYQREKFIKLCDKHHKKECDANIWLTCGTESKFGSVEMSVDMCDECVQNLLDYLKKEFNDRAIFKNSGI